MNIQEMFNKAVIGLRSQGFQRCSTYGGMGCAYSNEDGTQHCAWGWVDPSLGPEVESYIDGLAARHIGVASGLNRSELDFARKLQMAHDVGKTPDSMQQNLRNVALAWSLQFPEE